jgi:hypothetical protein
MVSEFPSTVLNNLIARMELKMKSRSKKEYEKEKEWLERARRKLGY